MQSPHDPQTSPTAPETFVLKDDGFFPNSVLPVVFYRGVFKPGNDHLDTRIEEKFTGNGWTGAWKDGVYSFHHYHSTTHEVLGAFHGTAVLRLGGTGGRDVEMSEGDVLVIPAGVAHQCVHCTADFRVVGAYPEGRQPDLLMDTDNDRKEAERNLPHVPLPSTDPLYGAAGPLLKDWMRAAG